MYQYVPLSQLIRRMYTFYMAKSTNQYSLSPKGIKNSILIRVYFMKKVSPASYTASKFYFPKKNSFLFV